MDKPKYNLGDTVYWIYSSNHYSKKIPCPMCFGKKKVEVILGDNSTIKSECGYCRHGVDFATGTATTWGPHAEIKSGKITGINMSEGWKYSVGYSSLYDYELFATEEEAAGPLAERWVEVKKQAEAFFKESFVNATEKQIWSAGYHRQCIERAKQTIEWHEARLGMIKDKKK